MTISLLTRSYGNSHAVLRLAVLYLIGTTGAMRVQAQPDSTCLLLVSGLHDVLGSDGAAPTSTLSTNITDRQARQLREAPGIVTVLLADEIAAAGARDLQEALTLLPGVTLGRDVDDAIGIGIRGNWAHEGKCLIMLNGSYLNENSYGTFALGQRIGLANISRIEMISGPGSVNYGGVAALGVINIVTKDAVETEGVSVVAQSGTSHGRTSRHVLEVFGGQRMGKTSITYSAFLDRGVRTAWEDTLCGGVPIDYADSTQIQSGQFTIGLRNGGSEAQLFVSEYNHRISDKGSEVLRRDLILDVGHLFNLDRLTTLDIKLGGRVQLPWSNVNDTSIALINSNTIDQRISLSTHLTRTMGSGISMSAGIQGYSENSRFVSPKEGNVFAYNGAPWLVANDLAAFAELSIRHRFGNLTAGGRYEKNSMAGDAFAPRFAYTKVFGRFHTKLLASRAFKLPTLQNMNLGPDDGSLTHETVLTNELELGYLIDQGVDLAMNLFSVDIKDPIVYVYDEANGTDNYINRPWSGTDGVDLKLNWDRERFDVRAHWSFYRVNARRSDLPEAELDGDPDAYQGLAQHAGGATLQYQLGAGLAIQAGANVMGTAQAYCMDPSGALVPFREEPNTLFNSALRWTPRRHQDLSLRVGCNNMGDVERHVLSTYSNGSSPLPLTGREWTFQVSYRFHP